MYINSLAERKKTSGGKKTGSQLALERARAMIDSAQSVQARQSAQTKSLAFMESMNEGRSAIVPDELSPMARLKGAADLSTQKRYIPVSSASEKKPVTSVLDADYYDTWKRERDRAQTVTVGGKSVLPTARTGKPEARDKYENIAYNVGAWLAPENADSGNFLNNLRYPIARLVAGALGFGEGVTDFAGAAVSDVLSEGAHMLGLHSVGDWFAEGSDYTRENNMTAAFSQGIADKAGEVSKLQGIAGDIYEGAGQLIPNILTGKALGGAANIAGDKVSKALIGLSSAGNATQEAYDEGADKNQATAYGAASGLLEVAIESIAGGIPGLGKGVTGKLMNKLKNSPATLKLLVDILGEGGEGALSTYLTPALKRMTYDPNAENASAEEIIRSAAMDSALSAITQGGNLPSSIAEDIYTLRSRAQGAKTAPAGAGAGVAAGGDMKTTPVEGEGDLASKYTFLNDKAEQEAAMADAYDAVMSEGRGVNISNDVLNKYVAISKNPAQKLIAAIKDYYDNTLKGTKVNVELNGNIVEVKFENDGKKKSVGWRMSPEKAATFESMHQMFETAKYAYSEINRDSNESVDVPQFHYFVTNANINGVDIPVKLQVRDLNLAGGAETRYYTHVLQNKSRGNDGPGTFSNTTESSHGNAHISSTDNSIFNPPEKINNNFSQGGNLPASIAEDVYTLRSRAQGAKTAPAGAGAGVAADGDADVRAAQTGETSKKAAVDEYVDYSISKSRFVENPLIISEEIDNLEIGEVSDRLSNDVMRDYGLDISGMTHVLNDNDIRHIYNRHGPHTNEKYPVTAADLKAIPDIVENYDNVYYVPREDDRSGLVFEKRHNGTTYYLEQIIEKNMRLQNKQMIKTSTGTVPDIKGLKQAIDKKRSTTPAPDKAAAAVPRMYVQDVWESAPDNSIFNSPEKINNNFSQGGNLPASIAEDVYTLRSRGQNAKTASVGTEASGDVDVKTASTGEADSAVNTDTDMIAGTNERTEFISKFRTALPQLSMSPTVATVTGTEMQNGGTKPTDRAMNFLSKIGNKIHRSGFGDVLFSRSKDKTGLVGHGAGNAKIELFAAVPSVIQNGKQIDYVHNWKGRGYDTYIFAAPVEYRDGRTYLGVIVQKDAQSGRYYLHEAVDSDGNLIYTDRTPSEAADRPAGIATVTDTVTSNGVSVDNSIFNSPEKINNNFSQGGNLPSSIAEDIYTLRSRAQGAKTAFVNTNTAMKNAPFKEGAGDGGRVSTVPEELSPVARLRNAGAQAEQSVNTDLKTLPMEEAEIYTVDEANRIRYDGKTFKNLVVNIDTTLSNFFNKWRNGRKSHQGDKLEKLYLGKLTDDLREDISKIVGYDVGDRDFIITNDDVKHIYDHHGNPKTEIKHGNLPLDTISFDELLNVIKNPDTIREGHLEHGNPDGRMGIVFEKSFDNGKMIYIQFDNSNRGTLQGRTLYIKNIEDTTSAVNASDNANTFTSKTTEPVSSNNSIFNPPEKINNNFSQGGKLPASIAEDVYTLRSRAQGTKTASASTNAVMKNAPFKEGAGDGGRVSTVPEELSPVARLRNAGAQAEQSVNTDLKTLPMEEASTVIDTDPAHHTDAQQRMIEEYQASVDDNLVEFYNRAKSDQNAGHYMLQNVSERASTDIYLLTGHNVSGFRTNLDARQAWHINNDHGINGRADHSMSNDNDVGRIQYVLDNYDNVEYGGTTDAYWEPKSNGANRRAPVVVFSKKVNGTYYVVEATPITKAKTVNIVSAYMLEDGKTPPGGRR